MFSDDSLKNLSLLLSVVGIIGMLVIASVTEPIEVSLGEISEEFIGKYVRTSGKVEKLRFHEDGHVFLTLASGNSKLKLVIFANVAKKLPINELEVGREIEVMGRVSEYRGELEIVVENLRLKSSFRKEKHEG